MSVDKPLWELYTKYSVVPSIHTNMVGMENFHTFWYQNPGYWDFVYLWQILDLGQYLYLHCGPEQLLCGEYNRQ